MLFKRHELGKDAKYGAIGLFVVIALLITMHFTGTTDQVFYLEAGIIEISLWHLYRFNFFLVLLELVFIPY